MSSNPLIKRSGTIFKPETGKLYEFVASKGRIWVLRGWPHLMAWRKTREQPWWQHFRPEIRVPAGNVMRRINHQLARTARPGGQHLLSSAAIADSRPRSRVKVAWSDWYAMIPMDVRKAIAPFSERHWHLLSLTSRCGVAALDLVASNPSLAFALASNWVFHRPAVQRPLRAARSLLARGRKQREILAWLGFPATESTRKILARVVPASVSVKVLMFLRQQLESTDTAKALGHLQRINAGVLRIAIDSTLLPAAMPQFLAEVADMRDEDKRAKAAYLLRDSLTMFNLLYPRRRFSLVRSVEKLRTIHNSLVDDFTRISHTGLNTPFPPPPIAGTPLIEPITGSHDLVEEGRTQHNCVASFARDVAVRNRTYIYRTLPPLERCTLALRRNGGRWTVSQIKATCNQPASMLTRHAVDQWLASASQPIIQPCGTGLLDDIPF